ncbi:hypothetical protein pdam_00025837, partial [Pocillopora damicornis]
AGNLKWPTDYRVIQIQSVLVEQAASYDTATDIILKGSEIVAEALRPSEKFARSKKQLFGRWCHSQRESKRCIHSDVRTFVDEQKAQTLEKGARLADELWLRHKVNFLEKPHQLQSSASFGTTMVCKTREVGRMTEDIQSRILLTITGIVSAPHGQDRTSLI